ncbi:hypothetical protein B0H11DRAFT_88341 [Mycena galericulata]|nr:hypothetical protein B0H11DRAFT_88341 [Mycena galericulata]
MMSTTIPLINRHFRQLSLPYTFKKIRVPNHNQLPAMFDFFRKYLSRINTICVGHRPLCMFFRDDARTNDRWHEYDYCPTPYLPAAAQFPKLKNLVIFNCIGFCFEPRELACVFGVSNATLRSLRLGWDASCLFPFQAFPILESLFIYVFVRDPRRRKLPPSRRIFPSLVTLSIIDNVMWFETTICGVAAFPNLRTLHLLPNSHKRHGHIFGFISDHPSLLDVNIHRILVNFPSFIKLAKRDRHVSWNTEAPFSDGSLGFEVTSLNSLGFSYGTTWHCPAFPSFVPLKIPCRRVTS